MKVADMLGDCLIRLPLFTDLTLPEVDAVVRCVDAFFTR